MLSITLPPHHSHSLTDKRARSSAPFSLSRVNAAARGPTAELAAATAHELLPRVHGSSPRRRPWLSSTSSSGPLSSRASMAPEHELPRLPFPPAHPWLPRLPSPPPARPGLQLRFQPRLPRSLGSCCTAEEALAPTICAAAGSSHRREERSGAGREERSWSLERGGRPAGQEARCRQPGGVPALLMRREIGRKERNGTFITNVSG
jgi:hypothetical protein